MNGAATFSSCDFGFTTQFAGRAFNSGLADDVSLTFVGGSVIEFVNCFSDIPGVNPPTLDFGADDNTQVAIRNYTGGLNITNMTDTGSIAGIDCISGRITIEASCTAGTILVGGLVVLTDNSGPGCTVIRRSLDPVISEQLTAYGDTVVIDAANGTAGTLFPIGTGANPVNNLADALTLASTYSVTNLLVRGQLIIGPTDNIDGYTVVGDNPLDTVVVLATGCSTANTEFQNLILTGVVNGSVIVRECGCLNLVNIGDPAGNPSLFYETVFLEGVVGFRSGLVTPGNIAISNCYSGTPSSGFSSVTFDLNAYNGSVQWSDYRNSFSLINSTHADGNFQFNLQGSLVTLTATCTAGSFSFIGYGGLSNLGSTADVDNRLNVGTSLGSIG
jgi:cytoskeletal protein CcmA (bactofilin family)